MSSKDSLTKYLNEGKVIKKKKPIHLHLNQKSGEVSY